MDVLGTAIFILLPLALVIIGLWAFARWRTSKLIGKRVPADLGKYDILYFYSPTCRACKRMTPVVMSLKEKVKVREIDVSSKEGLELARGIGVIGTPMVVVLREGRVKGALLGFREEEEVLKEVRR
ncbi:MAG TPA: thioredoxin [Aquificaceae bacterium]|nr:thioredoxin [Aquificaceae bacterium]